MSTAVVGLGDASDGWLLLDAGVFGEAVAPARLGVPAESIQHQVSESSMCWLIKNCCPTHRNALSRGGHAAGNPCFLRCLMTHKETNAALDDAAGAGWP